MDSNTQIGDDIRALRRSRNMTLMDLGARLGRSVGWLSQVERGQTAPSVRDLARIAAEFDVNISLFFRSASQNDEERGLVLREGSRVPIGSTETGLTEELLSPTLGGAFEMIRSVFAPHSDSGGLVPARPSEDGGILISGELSLTIGGQVLHLKAGDSFQFTQQPYAWRNDGDEPAVVFWVVSPPIY